MRIRLALQQPMFGAFLGGEWRREPGLPRGVTDSER